ncbi:MAG TPA: hypothetical protein VK205_04975 [Prolixibacteraceae bacterium]|nr:hypothetical protein [Prolixibacteraceae bacterium]
MKRQNEEVLINKVGITWIKGECWGIKSIKKKSGIRNKKQEIRKYPRARPYFYICHFLFDIPHLFLSTAFLIDPISGPAFSLCPQKNFQITVD